MNHPALGALAGGGIASSGASMLLGGSVIGTLSGLGAAAAIGAGAYGLLRLGRYIVHQIERK